MLFSRHVYEVEGFVQSSPTLLEDEIPACSRAGAEGPMYAADLLIQEVRTKQHRGGWEYSHFTCIYSHSYT